MRGNSDVDDCENKMEELLESKMGFESENENGEVAKIEVELQEENEGKSSEIKEELEVSLNEKESGVEEAFVITDNSLPILDNFVLQDNEDLISKINPVGIPPDPGVEYQIVGETSQQHHHLDILILSKVIPEEV